MRLPINQPASAPDVLDLPESVAGSSHQRMVGWRQKLKDSLQFCAAAGIMALLIIPLTLAAIGLWIYINLPDWPSLDER